MIWLASFPRSGNTFFRNVLYEVYGIESSTYHQDDQRDLEENYDDFTVVKTHMLPNQLPSHIKNAKSVYLIRDGRDALVSMAHHRKDIVDIGSDFYNNLLLAIMSLEGSYFGGWSENVKEWTEKADIVIRFKDLIKDPIKEIEKLRAIIDLPEPDLAKLPTFKQLKFGHPKYGDKGSKPNDKSFAQLNFRKGKPGGWKEEMPEDLHRLFWDVHRTEMIKNGYEQDILPARTDDHVKVLIDATKLENENNDGIKRYLFELLNHLIFFLQYRPNLEVDLFLRSALRPIGTLENSFIKHKPPLSFVYMDVFLRGVKSAIQFLFPKIIYRCLSFFYQKLSLRKTLNRIKTIIYPAHVDKSIKEEDVIQQNYDLIHIPLPQNLVHYKDVESKFIVTLHDITHKLFPGFHTESNIRNAEKGMQLAVEKKAQIIAISEASKKDAIKYYSIPENKINRIYEGAVGKFNENNRLLDIKPILAKYNLPDVPYLITLSTLEPRKNIKNTIDAFLQLKKANKKRELALVICGKKGWKYEELIKLSEEELAENNVYFTGFVDDVDLCILLAHAKALCYVSHYEGFGLPILEAMQSGTPVVYGNNSSMPEVAGRGGVGVDSTDVNAIKEAMESIAFDQDFQKELASLASIQAHKFSWLKTAFETLKVYDAQLKK